MSLLGYCRTSLDFIGKKSISDFEAQTMQVVAIEISPIIYHQREHFNPAFITIMDNHNISLIVTSTQLP